MWTQPSVNTALPRIPSLILGEEFVTSVKITNTLTEQKGMLHTKDIRPASAHELYHVRVEAVLRDSALEQLINIFNYCRGQSLPVAVKLPFDCDLGHPTFSYYDPLTGAYLCRYAEFRLDNDGLQRIYRVVQSRDDFGRVTTSRKAALLPTVYQLQTFNGNVSSISVSGMSHNGFITRITNSNNLTTLTPIGHYEHTMRLVDGSVEMNMLNIGEQRSQLNGVLLTKSEHIAEVAFDLIEVLPTPLLPVAEEASE